MSKESFKDFARLHPELATQVVNNKISWQKLYELYVDMKRKNIDNVTMNVLSMGMTNDYITAVEEGATMVRVGTALFGARNYNK